MSLQPRKKREAVLSKKIKQQDEFKRLEANFKRLKNMRSGLVVGKPDPKAKPRTLVVAMPVRREVKQLVGKITQKEFVVPKMDFELTDEMIAREKAAQEEIERKKKRVAVLYNKGAYQYITDEMDPKTFGRK
jgi:hypothetical protein